MKNNKQFLLKAVIIIIILLITLTIGGMYYYFNYISLPNSNLYLIDVKIKDKNKGQNSLLLIYIAQKLGIDDLSQKFTDLPMSEIMKLYYDTSKYKDPAFGFQETEFYLVPQNGLFPKHRYISDEYAEIKVNTADSNLLPYLENSKYCQSHNDCIIRASSCKSNVYNKYQLFIAAYGCEGPQGEYDKTAKCYRDVTYSNPMCENNICVAEKSVSAVCQLINF